MDTSKPWFASITIWGAIIAIAAPPIGALLHTTISADQQNTLASLLSQLGANLQTLGPVVGGIIAWIGRVRATTQIGGSGATASTKSK